VAGQFTESGGFSSSYESWVSIREGSAYYLQKQGKAVVLASEFGTSTGGDDENSYWNYVLKYFGDNDVNWCYWALDPIRYPKDADWAHTKFQSDNTFGIFDSKRKDYWAVVGWKLQALVGIMRPAESTPKHVEVPGACVFEVEPNVEAAKQLTSEEMMSTTANWSAKATLEMVLLIIVALLVPCCCVCCVCLLLLRKKNPEKYTQLVNAGTNNKFIEASPDSPRKPNNSWGCCGSGKAVPLSNTI